MIRLLLNVGQSDWAADEQTSAFSPEVHRKNETHRGKQCPADHFRYSTDDYRT
jgi:hypothetical protein